MTDAHWRRLTDLVPDALALPTVARGAFLDGACVDDDGRPDATLRREAARLVAASDAADASDALASPLAGVGAGERALPERIGPWRVTGLLGEGGMGVVYRAERADGLFERAVALKRIRPGLGHALAGRLDAERQVLARLEHDGIARLYDGGVSDDGIPYVVMELAEGAPITTHAESAGLDVEARVRLFVRVCEAVAYAHQRLVVHRDLKPSNVFVTLDGRAKLLDFGIAKLLGDAPADSLAAALTRTQAAMTPSYAAPEQLRRGEITTATDVYALGVLLYELLAGQRPYSLADTTAAEAERIVCETDPPPPSAAAPPGRTRQLRGDLDMICLKALAKEPSRRYPSAEALAADLERHLEGIPVEARPATAGYRLGRFARRHRAAVAATVLVAVALVAGAGAALWQAREARAEAAKALAVNTFLVDLFKAPNPEVDGRDVRVASLLDRAAAALDGAFGGAPETEAQLHLTLGITYRGLGLYDEAEAQLLRALAMRTALFGPDHLEVADAQLSVGRLYYEQGDYAASDSILTLALATERRRSGPNSLRTAHVLNELGMVQYDVGDYEAAARSWRKVLAFDEATRPPGDIEMNIGRTNLANALADLGRIDEAAALLERAVREYRQYHPDDSVLPNALANLGALRNDQGRAEEAAELQQESVRGFRTVYGSRHPKLAFGLSNLGYTLGALGRDREAEPLLRESAAIYGSLFGANHADHPDQGYPLKNLAGSLLRLGKTAEAEATARRAVAVFQTAFSGDNATTARARLVLAEILLATDRTAEAEGVLRQSVPILERDLPDDHLDRGLAQSLLGDVLRRQGHTADAAPLLRDGHALLRRMLGDDAPRTREAASRLAALGPRRS